MSSPAPSVTRRLATVAASISVHAALLVCVVLLSRSFRPPLAVIPREYVAGVEVAGGAHAIPLRLPRMDTAARTRHPARFAEAKPKTILPVKQPKPAQKAGGGSPAVPHSGEGSGQAAQGNGSDSQNAKPAFPVFAPRPPVTDSSMLPASAQKVVVDVKVDAAGQVVSETLVSGIGNGLDQIVLDTVKTWRFQPATVDGKAVPTQVEVICPFDQNYPITFS